MVVLRLEKKTKDEVVYKYFPEGEDAYGFVYYNFNTQRTIIEKIIGHESCDNEFYERLAKDSINYLVENNNFPDRFVTGIG